MTAWFILYVADLDASRDFYAAALDAAPTLDVPGMVTFDLGGATLGLMPEAGIERILPGLDAGHRGTSRAEVYVVVEDPAACHARALAAGAEELSPLAPRGWGDAAAYCRDADGHVLAFGCPLQ